MKTHNPVALRIDGRWAGEIDLGPFFPTRSRTMKMIYIAAALRASLQRRRWGAEVTVGEISSGGGTVSVTVLRSRRSGLVQRIAVTTVQAGGAPLPQITDDPRELKKLEMAATLAAEPWTFPERTK